MSRTIFIGDIHGCGDELETLLNQLHFSPSQDKLYLTGDAFTRGPKPIKVWNIIQQTEAQMVRGNHEDRLIKLFSSQDYGQLVKDKPYLSFTLSELEHHAGDIQDWILNLPLWILQPDFLLVHAGIHPEKGIRETNEEWFNTIRTWPFKNDFIGKRWHEFLNSELYPLVIFGHDAVQGLIIKKRTNGSPYLIGLDSGCVYGGGLTGYVLEENRIVQTESQKVHYTS